MYILNYKRLIGLKFNYDGIQMILKIGILKIINNEKIKNQIIILK